MLKVGFAFGMKLEISCGALLLMGGLFLPSFPSSYPPACFDSATIATDSRGQYERVLQRAHCTLGAEHLPEAERASHEHYLRDDDVIRYGTERCRGAGLAVTRRSP